MHAFNALLGRVEEAAASTGNESEFLARVCRLAVSLPGIALAWVGVPDQAGTVTVVGSAGRLAYLDGIVISVDPSTPYGRGPMGLAWADRLPHYTWAPDDENLSPWVDRLRQHNFTGLVSIPVLRGQTLWGVLNFYLSGSPRFTPDIQLVLEEIGRLVSITLDRIGAERLAFGLADTQRILLEHTEAGLAVTDGETVVVTNRHLAKMLAYDTPDALDGCPLTSLLTDEEDLRRVLGHGEGHKLSHRRVSDVRFARQDGRQLVCDVILHETSFRDRTALVWTIQDVSERVSIEAELARQAFQDALTGLPNRRALDAELPRAVARARRRGKGLAVGMLDIDDFKTVNDALGHKAGDQVLKDVSGRLRAHLRSTDFIARPGGDEFVILLEGLGLPFARDELASAVDRLHGATEEALVDGPRHRLPSEFSLGLAVFPGDGETGEELLRKADATLYALKARKHGRRSWWQLASDRLDFDPTEANVEAYGDEAATLLAAVHDVFPKLSQEWVETFHLNLEQDPATRELLGIMAPKELTFLKRRQAAHMTALFDPGRTREDLIERAKRLGEVLSLVGLAGTWPTHGITLYRRLLTERLNQVLLSSRERYRVLVVAGQRLQDELGSAVEGLQSAAAAYLDLLAQPLPAPGTRWVDASRAEGDLLAALPGVSAVLLLRLGTERAHTLEHAAGSDPKFLEMMRASLRDHNWLEPREGGAGVIETALRSDRAMSVPSVTANPRLARWWEGARAHRVASLLVIPVLDASHHATAGLIICGRHPNQFESPVMREFAHSVARRWEALWGQASGMSTARVVPEDVAHAWRAGLLGNGLDVHVQPVVDLQTGRLVGAEALARLREPSGDLIMPSDFLPLLGDVELARLFRLSLDQALSHVVQWKRSGIPASVSVNLPPGTLLIGECPSWVAQALERHQVDPRDLFLELLETQHIDEAERDRAIAGLVALGVRLALDDLGAGYSSLIRLSSLPLSVVKVDRFLVNRIKDEPIRTFVLLDALIQMTQRLGRNVIAEGLEDIPTLEAMTALGAPWGQGYAIARPMPSASLPTWSREFSLPFTPGTPRTYLGALAQHWKHGHAGDVAACPLTPLLEAAGPTAQAARHWHEDIHVGNALSEGPRALTDFLVARAAAEAGTTPSASSRAEGA